MQPKVCRAAEKCSSDLLNKSMWKVRVNTVRVLLSKLHSEGDSYCNCICKQSRAAVIVVTSLLQKEYRVYLRRTKYYSVCNSRALCYRTMKRKYAKWNYTTKFS